MSTTNRKHHNRNAYSGLVSSITKIPNSTKTLENLLDNKFQIIENITQIKKREKVLKDLEGLIIEWLKIEEVNLQTCIKLHEFARILPFGSYFLGAHCVGADIDVVCLCPNTVSYAQFFTNFMQLLAQKPNISCVKAVRDAHVPVLKMKMDDIELDLLLATSPVQYLSNHQILFLKDNVDVMDFESQKSIHGRLECQHIMDILPPELISKFQFVLKCIKFWAQRRGVYKSIYGYIGGFTCAILAAKICLMFPDMESGDIFGNFFRIFAQWPWPAPVMLQPCFYPVKHQEMLPVIGPVRPHKNTSHTICPSTFNILRYELQRGEVIVNKISHSLKQENGSKSDMSWENLFESIDFFNLYPTYISVCAESPSWDLHSTWTAFLESRVRYLILEMEQVGIFPHMYPKYYTEVVNRDDHQVYKSYFFMGLDLIDQEMEFIDDIVDGPIDTFINYHCRLNQPNGDIHTEVLLMNREQIPEFVHKQTAEGNSEVTPLYESISKLNLDSPVSAHSHISPSLSVEVYPLNGYNSSSGDDDIILAEVEDMLDVEDGVIITNDTIEIFQSKFDASTSPSTTTISPSNSSSELSSDDCMDYGQVNTGIFICTTKSKTKTKKVKKSKSFWAIPVRRDSSNFQQNNRGDEASMHPSRNSNKRKFGQNLKFDSHTHSSNTVNNSKLVTRTRLVEVEVYSRHSNKSASLAKAHSMNIPVNNQNGITGIGGLKASTTSGNCKKNSSTQRGFYKKKKCR